MERYKRFSAYLKKRFECRVYKVTVDAGFSCPNLDGTISRDGCFFCDNKAFSPAARHSGVSIERQIISGIRYGKKRYKAEKFFVYFQPYSNTHADVEKLKKAYDVVRLFGKEIAGISIGTRPDCIDRQKLDIIAEFGKDYEVWIEYGLQSVKDKTLKAVNRNHSYGDFLKAVDLTRMYGEIKICAHVIVGLPGETVADMLDTAAECGRLAIEGIKIHPMHVVKNTKMEELLAAGIYRPLSLHDYAGIVSLYLSFLHPETVIHRMTADCPDDLLVAPSWIKYKEKVIEAIETELEKKDIVQGVKTG